MKKIAFNCDERAYERLKILAKGHGVKVSAMLAEIVRARIDNHSTGGKNNG